MRFQCMSARWTPPGRNICTAASRRPSPLTLMTVTSAGWGHTFLLWFASQASVRPSFRLRRERRWDPHSPVRRGGLLAAQPGGRLRGVNRCGNPAAHPCGNAAHPCGNAAHPCGNAAHPCGNAAHPCGNAAHPCGNAAHPCGNAAHPCGNAAHPCGNAAHPCGNAAHPCGNAVHPCGNAVHLCGNAAHLCGNAARLCGNATRPADIVRIPCCSVGVALKHTKAVAAATALQAVSRVGVPWTKMGPADEARSRRNLAAAPRTVLARLVRHLKHVAGNSGRCETNVLPVSREARGEMAAR
jgi:hypothetical protein